MNLQTDLKLSLVRQRSSSEAQELSSKWNELSTYDQGKKKTVSRLFIFNGMSVCVYTIKYTTMVYLWRYMGSGIWSRLQVSQTERLCLFGQLVNIPAKSQAYSFVYCLNHEYLLCAQTWARSVISTQPRTCTKRWSLCGIPITPLTGLISICFVACVHEESLVHAILAMHNFTANVVDIYV